MYRKILTTARGASPIEGRLVICGVGTGLIAGLMALPATSVETATARGIAVSVSVALGSWLGIKLWLLTLSIFKGWRASLDRRIEALTLRLELATGQPAGQKPLESGNSDRAHTIWWLFAGAVPFGFTYAMNGAVLAAIDLRVSIYDSPVDAPLLLIMMLSGFGIALSGLAGKCLYLWQVARDMARLERRLDSVTSVAPITLQTHRLDHAIDSVSYFVCKLAGVRMES